MQHHDPDFKSTPPLEIAYRHALELTLLYYDILKATTCLATDLTKSQVAAPYQWYMQMSGSFSFAQNSLTLQNYAVYTRS